MITRTAILLAAALSACNEEDGILIPKDADPVPFDVLDQVFGDFRINSEWSSGPARRVVRTEAEWEALYLDVTGSAGAPAISFTDRSIIFAAMGDRQTTGYDVVFDEIWKDGDHLFVIYREISPGPGCGIQPGPTSPVAAVRTIKDFSVVTYIIHQVIENCTVQ